MNGFARFLIWIIILAVVGYFGYQAYVKWWDADVFQKKTQNVTGTVASTTERAKQTVGEKTAEIKQKAETYVEEVAEEAKDGALDFVKKKIGEGISSIGNSISGLGDNLSGEKKQTTAIPVSISNIVQNYYPQGGSSPEITQIPAPTSSTYFKPPSTTSIIAQTNSPLVFSINANVSYQVDWGDGEKESGVETGGNVKLLSHAWKEKGDYNVTFVISNNLIVKEYSFPIRVY